jgi:hypothetical protein
MDSRTGSLLFLLALAVAIPWFLYDQASKVIGTTGTNVLIGACIVLFIWMNIAAKRGKAREAERRRQEEARRLRREAEDESRRLVAAQQVYLGQEIDQINSSAIAAFSQIPRLLLDAEAKLDTAEKEFSEGMFSPFWEAVEKSLRNLASASSNVDRVAECARRHASTVERYKAAPAPFPVDARCSAALELAKKTEQRLRAIVRTAQKDFQFATIYEQRRNTNVLIDGFKTLSEAVDRMGARIQFSLQSLGDAIRELESGQAERHSESIDSMRDVRDILNNASATASKEHLQAMQQRERVAEEQRQFSLKELSLLDNIQRGRAPLDEERGPRPQAIWDT